MPEGSVGVWSGVRVRLRALRALCVWGSGLRVWEFAGYVQVLGFRV